MTADDPVFLSLEQVLALHRRQLDEHGGLDGVYHPMNQAVLVNAMLNIADRQLDKRGLAGLFRKAQSERRGMD